MTFPKLAHHSSTYSRIFWTVLPATAYLAELPQHLANRFRPFGHLFSIVTLAYSPNGQLIATGTVDKKIRIWEALTVGQVGDALEGHAGYIQALAFSPDGRRLVSGALDDGLRVWDVDTHEIIAGPFEDDAHTWIRSVMYSPDGELIASGGNDGLLCLWNAYTHERVAMIQHSGPVTSLSFSPNGERIASVSLPVHDDEPALRVHAVRRDKLPLSQPELTFSIPDASRVARYSPDGLLIAGISAGSENYEICLWYSATGTLATKITDAHTGLITDLSFSPDGRHLVSSSMDNKVRLWDVATDTHSHRERHSCSTEQRSATVSEPTISLSLHSSASAFGHDSSVTKLSCSPDGLHFASCDSYKIRIWNMLTGALVLPQPSNESRSDRDLSQVDESQPVDESKLNVTGSLYRTSEGDLRHFAHGSSSRLFGHFSTIVTLAYSPDGSLITTGSADSVIRIWDSRTGHQSGDALIGHTSWIQVVAYSPDGGRLVSGAHNDRLRVWDTKTYGMVTILSDEQSVWVRAVQYSPDGKIIASGYHDGCLNFWNARTHERVASIHCLGTVASLSFSPSGNHIAVSASSQIHVVDVDSRETKFVFHPIVGRQHLVRGVQYSPDGRSIASVSDKDAVCFWDAVTGELTAGPLRGRVDELVTSISFSMDGRYFVSGSAGSNIEIWDATTGNCVLRSPHRHDSTVTMVACSPDGKHVASCDGHSLHISELSTGKLVLPRSPKREGPRDAGQEGRAQHDGHDSDLDDFPVTLSKAKHGQAAGNIDNMALDGNADEGRQGAKFTRLRQTARMGLKKTASMFRQLRRRVRVKQMPDEQRHTPASNDDACPPTKVPDEQSHTVNVNHDRGDEKRYWRNFWRRSWRRTENISPAYGNQRIWARKDVPGRRPGGDTQPLEDDVSDSDSASSDESSLAMVDRICFCLCVAHA